MVFDLEFDYEACFTKDPSLKKLDIAELKSWVQNLDSTSNVPKNLTDKQLLVFHKACQKVIEDTKKCIKVHYKLKENHPDHFDDRDPMSDIFMQLQEVQEHLIIKERTDDGYTVTLHRLHDFAIEKYDYSASCKWASMSYDSVINEEGPDDGLIALFDLRGAKLGHLIRVNIGYMSKYMKYLQEGFNGRIVSIHIFNVIPLFDMIMKVMKPFLKAEIKNMIVLHRSDIDWEEFHRDVIPKRCLPSDFGGDLPDTQTLHKENTERVIRNKPHFDAEEKQRHFYSKKKKKSNIELEFTKLDID